MEIILEILAELFLQLLFEGLAEVGIHQTRSSREINPLLAGFGYLTFGAVLGGLSLIFFPESFIENQTFKLVNLLLTPVILGFVMLGIGRLRRRKGQATVRLEKFAFGFLENMNGHEPLN